MTDVQRWLDTLGLGQYIDAFEENAIELDLLTELTDDDLRTMGIAALGHRKRILKAISEMGSETESAAVLSAPTSHDQPVTSGTAERRQLTVMFCDLVGSTTLSESMDAEDYRDLLTAYQAAVSVAIREHEGYIARYMGDGLLIYFGYPLAQENDPERAARAGLAVVDAVGALKGPLPLQVRVGIATGAVVVGDIIGEGASEEAAVLGETPNLAARLQGAAAPNTVLLSPGTQQLLKGRIETQALEPVELNGLSRAIVPHRALRARSLSDVSESQLDSSPLIGRDVDVALLERAWRHAQSLEGQAVLLSGDAGVGKSRLLRAFQETIAEDGRTRVQWHCSPYYQTTANFPAIEQLKRSVQLDEQDVDKSVDWLVDMVRDLGLDEEDLVPILALLLSVPVDGRHAMPDYSPDEIKRRLISAQVDLLLAAAKHAPLLFIIEDLHWADPTTVEVLREMVAAIRDKRVLILMTARPEFRPPWSEQSNAISHRLSSLTKSETMALVQGIAKEHGLNPEIVERIVERTDGVPIFIEELTKSVLESTDNTAVPASLKDSLMARLDRLGSVKAIAQTASVIGRRFTLSALSAITDSSPERVIQELSEVTASGLLLRRLSGEFEFTHALFRDAAYESILRRTRCSIHSRYAAHLRNAGEMERQPELLARHYAAAELHADAAECWAVAGRQSLARSAIAEGAASFNAALDSLARVESTEERCRLEVEFRVQLGHAYTGLYGRGNEKVLGEFEQALSLCEAIGDERLAIQPLRGLVLSLPAIFPRKALTRANQLKAFAQKYDDSEADRDADGGMVAMHYLSGNFRSAVEVASTRLALVKDANDTSVRKSIVFDSRIELQRHYAMSCDALGLRDKASALMRESRELAAATNRPYILANALIYSAKLMTWQRLYEEAWALATEALAIAQHNRLPLWVAGGKVFIGRALAARGDCDDGLSIMREGVTSWRTPSWYSEWHTHYADALLHCGHVEQAADAIGKAESFIDSVGAMHYASECHRLKGLVALANGESQQRAESSFAMALDIARKQGARTFELQAALELAKIWRDHGDSERANNLVQPIYVHFQEGAHLPLLKDVAAFLRELR